MNENWSKTESNDATTKNPIFYQRLELLGIRDPYEASILSVISQLPKMPGEMGSVFRNAARELGKAYDDITAAKLNNASRELLSRRLLRIIQNSSGTLLYLHGEIWTVHLREMKLVLLELYNLIYSKGNVPIDLNSAVPELKDRLAQIHSIKTTADIEDLVMALAREGKEHKFVLLLTELEFSSLCDNYLEGGERHVQKAEKALHPGRESPYSEKAPC